MEFGHGFDVCFLTRLKDPKPEKSIEATACEVIHPFAASTDPAALYGSKLTARQIETHFVLLLMAEKQTSNISHGMRDHECQIVRQRLVYDAAFDAPCLYPSQHVVPTSELIFRQGLPN